MADALENAQARSLPHIELFGRLLMGLNLNISMSARLARASSRSIREGDRVTAERRKPSNLPRATAVQHYLRFAFMPQQRRKPGLFALLLRKVPGEIDCLLERGEFELS